MMALYTLDQLYTVALGHTKDIQALKDEFREMRVYFAVLCVLTLPMSVRSVLALLGH